MANDNNNKDNKDNENNNNSIKVKFPKCPNCDIYLNFYQGLVFSGLDQSWYNCVKCNGLYLR